MPGGNGRNSKRQTGRTHHDSVSQSGSPQRNQTPKPQQRSQTPKSQRSGSIGGDLGRMLFGPGPKSTSHGGSKKGRKKKGGGSR